jgi:hypothetical protein
MGLQIGLSLDNFIIWKEVKLAANFIKKLPLARPRIQTTTVDNF